MESYFGFLSDSTNSVVIENLRNISFIIGSIVGIWLLYIRSRALKKQAEIAEKGHNLDRFTDFLNLLESDNYNIRISAVQSLKLLMIDERKYYWPIIKVFSSYTNHYLPIEKNLDEDQKKLDEEHNIINRTVVQEMIRALGDEKINWLPHIGSSDVRSIDHFFNSIRAIIAYLIGHGTYKFYYYSFNQAQKNKYTLVFRRSDLNEMSFAGLFLSIAEFRRCQLNNTYFSHSDLEYSKFYNCALNQSKLINSNFCDVQFYKCSLREADFSKSSLYGAKFIQCDLTGAKNLTIEQLSKVKSLYQAKLDP